MSRGKNPRSRSEKIIKAFIDNEITERTPIRSKINAHGFANQRKEKSIGKSLEDCPLPYLQTLLTNAITNGTSLNKDSKREEVIQAATNYLEITTNNNNVFREYLKNRRGEK